MQPVVDHIQITVRDMAVALPFYDALLPLEPLGARIVSAPREFPEYSPNGYYAVFFKDPDGIKYEIMYTPKPAADA